MSIDESRQKPAGYSLIPKLNLEKGLGSEGKGEKEKEEGGRGGRGRRDVKRGEKRAGREE